MAQGDPHRWRWKDVRRHHTGRNGRWVRPSADGVELFNLAKVPIRRYRVAAPRSPIPGSWPTPPDGRHSGEPVAWKLARRVRRAARRKRTDGNIGTAPKADSTIAIEMPADQRRGGFVPVLAQVWQKWRTTGADRGGVGRTGLRLLEYVLRGVSEVS